MNFSVRSEIADCCYHLIIYLARESEFLFLQTPAMSTKVAVGEWDHLESPSSVHHQNR